MKAIIFDMDGVISDTEHIHTHVNSEIFKRYGIHMTPQEISERFAGVPLLTIYRTVFDEHRIAGVDLEALTLEKRSIVLTRKDEIVEMPGAIEFLIAAKLAGLKVAIASGSAPEYIDAVLSKLNIAHHFDIVAHNGHVPRGKPAPDMFLFVAEQLGIPPAECVVIEDGINGMIGAKAAGMKCIALVHDDRGYPADLLIRGFKELDVEKIKDL